jgi:hypothetical protein
VRRCPPAVAPPSHVVWLSTAPTSTVAGDITTTLTIWYKKLKGADSCHRVITLLLNPLPLFVGMRILSHNCDTAYFLWIGVFKYSRLSMRVIHVDQSDLFHSTKDKAGLSWEWSAPATRFHPDLFQLGLPRGCRSSPAPDGGGPFQVALWQVTLPVGYLGFLLSVLFHVCSILTWSLIHLLSGGRASFGIIRRVK